MRTILLLTILFLWSCDNSPSTNDSVEEVAVDSTSSIDTVLEPLSLPVNVQEKQIIDPSITAEDFSKHVSNWCMSLSEFTVNKHTLNMVLVTGKYKVILRTNAYGVVDTTKAPPLFEKARKKITDRLPFSENFPENIIHEWYEDSTTTEPMTYLWFEPNIEAAKIAIHEKK